MEPLGKPYECNAFLFKRFELKFLRLIEWFNQYID